MLWQLWEDSLTDEIQESMLHQAIENKDYLYILGSKEWKIPVHSYNVQLTTSTKTKIDILKKMVMFTFFNMKINNLKELSELLRVDSLFIKDIVSQMLLTGVLEKEESIYRLTKIGEQQLKAGTILSNPITEQVKFDYSVLNKYAINSQSTNQMIEDDWLNLKPYRYLDNENNLTNVTINESTLRKIIQEIGEVFEVGGSEKIISKIEPVNLEKQKFAKCVEYQLYDLLEDKVYARVWNGALSRWDEEIERYITEIEGPSWKEEYDRDIIENFPERYKYLKEKLKNFNDVKDTKKSLDILRGKDIRQRFLNSFSETKRKMLMVSPWISETVVDKEMLIKLKDFAKQGKTLYISWGISKNLNFEDRKPDQSLLDTLKEIVHEDGTQAIFVRWFGNQHNKEIVIDNRTHLLGSFNWLSYRGEYSIRHESVVVIKEEKVINDTIDYIEEKFLNALKNELPNLILNISQNVIEEKIIKNWIKELILLDSKFEERKILSDQLIKILHEHSQNELIHEISCIWVRYNTEDFGVRLHLANLLKKNELTLAENYFTLCQNHLKGSPIIEWPKSPELLEFKEWTIEHMIKVTTNKKQPTKQKNTNKNNNKKKNK